MNSLTGAGNDSHLRSVDETAARWLLRMHDPVERERLRREFEHWLAAAPEHRAAYAAMERAWGMAGEEAAEADVRRMRETALRFQPPPRPWWARPPGLAAAAVLLAVALVPIAWLLIEGSGAGQTGPVTEGNFQTAIGERATVRLSDGSVVTLNTASHMRVDLSGARREVRLLQGQAIFEVAKDPARAFVVFAADRRITALGTAFDVRVEDQRVRVTLVEGKVAVEQLPGATEPDRDAAPALPSARAQLQPGEQLVAPIGGVAVVQGADVQRVISWREGRLIFEADHLSAALAEMNRYATRPILLEDPRIGDLRLSGVFRTGQPEAFARALEEYFPLQVIEREEAMVLRWRK